MLFRVIMAVLVLFGWAAAAPAQHPALDLIPHDAGAAIAVRNLQELKAKGEAASNELNLRQDVKFSTAFDQLYDLLGLKGVVDENNAAAFVIVSAKSVGLPPVQNIQGLEVLPLLVGVVPFKDRDQIGERLGFKKGELKTDQIQGVTKGTFNNFHAYVRGKHLYLGFSDKSVKYAATTQQRFGENLTVAQRKQFGQADVVLEAGTIVWGKLWEDGILKAARRVLGEKMDAKEKAMGEKIVKAMEGIRFGLAGLRIEKTGLNFSLLSSWDKENKDVQEVLGLLRYGDTPTNLKGLPLGNVLQAEAAKGNGVANAMLARVLFKATLQETLGTDEITTPAERAMVVGVFNEIWHNLLGNKTALYRNTDTKKGNALTLISILDTADGEKFYKHMAELAAIADGSLKSANAGQKGALDVDQLVKDLGSKDARKHELALLKLRLLGGSAQPALEKAGKGKNKDLAKQAKALHEEIELLIAERAKGPAPANWFLSLRPTLHPLEKTGAKEGFTLKEMQLKLPKHAQHLSKNLKELFGPEWDRVRFAFAGKNVVVVWGSDLVLFEQTLNNLKEGEPGLAASKSLQTFYQTSSNARRLELHFAAAPLMALFDAGPAALPKAGSQSLTSLGLLVEPDSLQIDLWLPLGEARLLAKVLNF